MNCIEDNKMDITKLPTINDEVSKNDDENDEITDDLLKLDFTGKKKKKNKKRHIDLEDAQQSVETLNKPSYIDNGDGDTYTYEYLLERVYGKIYNNNPELAQRPTKIHLQPPEVAREGTKKTVVSNFAKLCKELNRKKEHVMSFILSELCADGSIDGTERLIIRGKYPPSAIERVARNYITEYVLCHGCKSLNTYIEKDKTTRLMFLKCHLCQSSVTIKPIVHGYRAKC